MTIYEAICAPYFGEVKLLIRSFINQCKKHPNEPQNIPDDIKKNIRKLHNKRFYMRRCLGFIVK